MSKLIDADRLLEELKKSCKWHAQNSRELSLLERDINIVKEQPTIDAVPVVRCRDCAFCLFGYQCLPNDEPTKPDNYCWKGRREDATD